MLPGFRFLFSAIALSMSILVFGLGAAALLRAAHEEFASNPTWRAPPETMFAQQAEEPVLAMLQIEPQPAAQKVPDNVPAVALAAEPVAILQESSLPEAAKSETPVAESPAQSETTSAQPDTQADDTTKIAAPDAETKMASLAQTPPPQIVSPVSETAPIAAEPAAPAQASAQDLPEMDAISTKLATLGSVPIPTKRPSAISKKLDDAAVKKRLQARRAAQRRRLAARARLAAAQQTQSQQPVPPAQQLTPQQQASTPFDQPSAQATPRR